MKFKEGNESGFDSKNFVKLKDKEYVTGVFRGDPYEFRQHWKDNKSELCSGTGCELCKVKKPSFRFRLNFIMRDPETKLLTAKIFEQGWEVYKTLKAFHEGGDYDLEKTFVKITRQGIGQDTKYHILPTPNSQLNPEQDKAATDVQLLNLMLLPEKKEETENFDNSQMPPFHTMNEQDIPF